MTVKIQGKLPDHAGSNGIVTSAVKFAADPRTRRLFIVAADVGKTELVHCRDDETGDEWDETVVTLRVRAIEQMDGEHADAAEQLLGESRQERENASVAQAMRGWSEA